MCASWFLDFAGVVVSVEDLVSEFGWDVFFASFSPVVCHFCPCVGKSPSCVFLRGIVGVRCCCVDCSFLFGGCLVCWWFSEFLGGFEDFG